jgi:hypothetical protein
LTFDPSEQTLNESLIAAGGNSSTARSLRVESQLRDRKGRWVEMGRDASIDVRIGGVKRKIIGKFVGTDPQAPGVRGLFLVEADPEIGLERGVYSFSGKAVKQVLASLDANYLRRQGIADPTKDVNGNLVGNTLDVDIDDIEDVYREEVGELDEALADGRLDSDEVAEVYQARASAGSYGSYNVVANLEEADTEVLTRDQLQKILKDAGFGGEDAPRRVNFDDAERPASRDSEVGLVERSRSRTTDGREVKVGDPTFGAKLIYVDPPGGFGRGFGRLVWQNPDGSLTEYNPSTHGSTSQMGQRGLNQPDPNAGRYWTGDPKEITYDKPRAKRKPKAESGEQQTEQIVAADIQVDDVIKTSSGKFKKVTKKSMTDSGPRLTFEDGTVDMYDDRDIVEIEMVPETPEAVAELPDSEEEKPKAKARKEKPKSNGFQETKNDFENPSEEEASKPADQRKVGHWYVDENGNVYPDRDGTTDASDDIRTPENERFWNRETNRVYDGNGNELIFTPTYDDKFVPIPEGAENLPSPMGESGFWDRNQLGTDSAKDNPQYQETDNPEEIIDALAKGKFVKTSTLRAAYDAIKLAISKKFKPKGGEKPSQEELEALKASVRGLPLGQQYQINRAIDLDSLNKEETAGLNELIGGQSSLTPEQMSELHDKFRNQPIDLTNLQANGSKAYSQNNAGAIREEMPPLASFNRPIFEKDLDRLGIPYNNEMMQADDMNPLQAEMSMDNVAGLLKAMEDGVDLWKKGTSRIYVDRDGNILDGHHRWAAALALQWKDGTKMEIPVTRLDLPRDEALALMNEWANSRGIPGQKLVDNRGGLGLPDTQAPAVEEAPSPTQNVPMWDQEQVDGVLSSVAINLTPRQFPGLDIEGFTSGTSNDPDVMEAIDMAYYMSDIIERSGSDDAQKQFLYRELVNSMVLTQVDKTRVKAGDAPKFTGKADTVRKITARKEGATIDPLEMKQPRTGIAVALDGFSEEIADTLFFNQYLGDLIVADYIDRNKDKFAGGQYKLGTWHDKDNNEVTFDIVEVFPTAQREEAKIAGQERNQQGIFDLATKEYIPTDGTGDRGRARKEREEQRKASDGRGAGPELGEPGLDGEGRPSEEPETPDARGDGDGRERLTLERNSRDLYLLPIDDRKELDYPELNFDLSNATTRQRQLVKTLNETKKRLLEKITLASKTRDIRAYEREVTWGKALNDTVKRIFGQISDGIDFRFGQGEKERLSNMTFFTNTEVRDEETGTITALEGIYIGKTGEQYYLKYSGGRRAAIQEIYNGVPVNTPIAYVDLSWDSESAFSGGPKTTTSIAYLKTEEEARGKGLAGAAVTFARYIVESSGREFAHSSSLTPMGANNSKGIEPDDPRRHHFSQSEKILQLMGAPTMKMLEKQGWFTGDYKILGPYAPESFNKEFLKPLDGRRFPSTNAVTMKGPVYNLDAGLRTALYVYTRNVEAEKRDDYLKDYLDSDFTDFGLQFMVEDLNWKDGISKDDAIQKLKNTEEALIKAKKQLKDKVNEGESILLGEGEQLSMTVLIQNVGDIRRGLEEDKDFDSKRLDRPEPIDLTIPNRTELKIGSKQETDRRGNLLEKPLVGISPEYHLENFANDTADVGFATRIASYDYEARFGVESPSGWTTSSSTIARRFSVEQLKEALEKAIKETSVSDEETSYAELDFRREFSPEPEIGKVPILNVARALYKKSPEIGGVSFKEYLAEQIDKAYAIEDNINAVDAEKKFNAEYFQQMDKFLSSIGENREDDTAKEVQNLVEPDPASPPKFYYSSENEIVYANEELPEDERDDYQSQLAVGRLIENETFDELPNDLGSILTLPSPQIGYEEQERLRRDAGFDAFNVNGVIDSLARKYRLSDLIDGFKDATKKGKPTISFEYTEKFFANVAYTERNNFELDIRIVRDALQKLNVDTNALISSEVIPNLSNSPELTESQILNLHSQGLMEPKSIQDIIANANEVVNIRNLVLERTFDQGASGPGLYSDPVTGQLYVVKRYHRMFIAQMEITTQALYQAAGINASNPRFGEDSSDPDAYYVVTDFVEDAEFDDYRNRISGLSGSEEQIDAREAVLNGLPMDILLDNLDGPFNSGNLVYDSNGGYIRIDGGGGLLSDPSPEVGDKRRSGRYRAMFTSDPNLSDEERKEQERVLEIAMRDGSFEGRGIEFSYEYFLNPASYHWNEGGGMRPYILDNFDEDVFRERVRNSLFSLTPDKINQLVDGMPIDEPFKKRIKETLIYRRAHMLNKYGLEDNFDLQAKELEQLVVEDSDRSRLGSYVARVSDRLDAVDQIYYKELLEKPTLTKAEVEIAIEELLDKEIIALNTPGAVDVRPGLDWNSDSVAEILNDSDEKPDTDQLSTEPLPESNITGVDLKDVMPNDIIEDPFDTTYNGRVLFNIKKEDGTNRIAVRKNNGKVKIYEHDSEKLSHNAIVRRYTSESLIPAETDFDANIGAARERYLQNLKRRSNKVLEAVRAKYVNNSVLSNGDVVISSRVFITAGGRTYKYQVVVHRKADEEFVSYVREWEIGRDGAPIGPVRVNKMTSPTHSPKALLNKIAPLIQGRGIGQGVYGRNPRNWFNQGNSFESEVTDPRTGMPIPRSLAGDLDTKYITDTGIQSTGDSVKDAIVSYVGKLVSKGVTASDVFRRLGDNGVIPRGKLLDIIERVEANRAFPGINQVPYLSRNKKDVVRIGDRVRHYAPNGQIKEGVVRARRALSVSRKPNGDYEYTDVLVVKFDGRAQGTPIVAKNLEIISRVDGNVPNLESEPVEALPRSFDLEDANTIPNVSDSWNLSMQNGESGYLRMDGPADAPLITINRVRDMFGRDRFLVHEYVSLEQGRTPRSEAIRTLRFNNLPNAVVTAENIAKSYEEDSLERGQTPKSPSEAPKFFNNAEGIVELDDVVKAIRRNKDESPCAITASLEACDITKGLRFERVEGIDGGHVDLFYVDVPGVDNSAAPVYRIARTRKNRTGKNASHEVFYWTNPNDVGDESKARVLKIKKGKTIDEAVEYLRKDAERRIEYARGIPAGKNTRTLSIDMGNGEVFTEEVDYETYEIFRLSNISKEHFTLQEDGTVKMSEARQAYYREQMAFHLEGIEAPKGRNPIMYIFGGSPASGKGGFTKKGSALAKLIKGETPEVKSFNTSLTGLETTEDGVNPTAVIIDPDVFKLRLPEVRYRHLKQLMNRALGTAGLKKFADEERADNSWANDSHEESSLMAKMLTKAAQDKGLDIVLDAVNAEKSKAIKKANQAREKGYKVVGRYIEASFAVSMPDAAKRGFNTGREVPLEVQLSSLKHLTNSLTDGEGKNNRIWEAFDEFELFHRDGGDFTEIATWSEGQDGLNFTGRNSDELQMARDLHEEYVGLAQLSEKERNKRIKAIEKKAQAAINAVLERKRLISTGRENELADAEDALATEVELELFALQVFLEQRYPGYATKNSISILRNLIDDLGQGKLSDKEFGKIIGENIERIKKTSKTDKNPNLTAVAKEFEKQKTESANNSVS